MEIVKATDVTAVKIDTFAYKPAETSSYIPSMEPHGMRNLSQSEEASFLGCICNLNEEGGAV